MFIYALIFTGILVLAAVGMAAYSYIRYGQVQHWEDWVTAIAAAILVSGVLAIMSPSAEADTGTLKYTQVYFGLEYPVNGSHPACDRDGDQITSNVGIDQNLIGYGPIDVNATYRHHSCAVGSDREISDTLGVNAIIRFEW